VSDTAYPLLLSFHGHGGTAAHQERVTGFSQLADQAGFLVAYPQGAVGTDGLTGWASGGVGRPTVNDVLFVSELLSNLQAQVCVNPKRIYATGFSNGGGMTSLLACDLPDRIAAFASVAGSYYVPEGGCHPSRPVPILEFHGTSDPVVPYAGRPAQGELGVMEWLDEWAARDACGASPLTTALRNGITQLIWSDCAHGASVVHYRLTDGLHTWPTQSTSGTQQLPRSDTALNATILIWHFFEAHALPAA
jgi:polyhydroxybutyrate depolymerase